MADVFVVRGSEDGDIGVFTTRRRAVESALEYLKDWKVEGTTDVKELVRRLGKEDFFGVYITCEDSQCCAEITRFGLNQ